MPIRTNGTDIQTIMCPAVNGVRPEADAVRIHNGTAWVDVWTNRRPVYMYEHSNTLRGKPSVYAEARQTTVYEHPVWTIVSSYQQSVGVVGYMADVNLTNPVIRADTYGSVNYTNTTGTYNLQAGTMYIIGVLSNGNNYTLHFTQLGNENGSTQGVTEKVLEGTFVKLGYLIELKEHGWLNMFYSITIREFLVNNKPFLPDPSLQFNT